MGLKERVTELQGQEYDADAKDRAIIFWQRYKKGLPEAIKKQRALFGELKIIGVIALLEEMTNPHSIEPPATARETFYR